MEVLPDEAIAHKGLSVDRVRLVGAAGVALTEKKKSLHEYGKRHHCSYFKFEYNLIIHIANLF